MPENQSIRHKSFVALILIDVINHFDFPDGYKILKNAQPVVDRGETVPARRYSSIYVNDNFGQWRSDSRSLVSSCVASHCATCPFVESLQPDDHDYFVLKPMHSAFFQTP